MSQDKFAKIFSLIILCSFFVCPFVSAEITVKEMQEEINETLKDKLNLSQEQLTKIKEEQSDQISKRKALATQEDTKRTELKAELEKVDSDPKKVDALVQDLNTIREEVIDLRVESVKTLKTILTNEQYEKVVEIQKEEQKEKVEKKKEVEQKWDIWKEKKKIKKNKRKKWYYYYW